LFGYNQTTAKAIITLKYKLKGSADQLIDQLVNLRPVKHPLVTYWQRQSASLVPIPSHKSRYRWRGFELSQVMATKLGRLFNLPVKTPLDRHRPSRLFITLGRSARYKQLKQAFRLTDKPPSVAVLIDDVITTGATIRSAAVCLYRGGAKEVWFVSLTGRI